MMKLFNVVVGLGTLLLMLSFGEQVSFPNLSLGEEQNVSSDAILEGNKCGRWSALDFGVVANDETVDNTLALQKALDHAGEAGGGVVELPSGRFRFDGVLKIPTGVTLQGTYRVPPTVVNKDEKPTGTTLLTYANRGKPDESPFIDLQGSNSALIGVVVTYPEWEQTDVPPVPYPPCVFSNDTDNVAVIDCCLLNPYEGIKFVYAHRHLVRNITGYPSFRGLYVDQCYDIGHIENIHFWPFGVTYKPDDPYCEWVNINGTAFEFARTDWHYVSNTFCFGYGYGYLFSDRGHGGTNGNFLGIGADSCRRAVLVKQSQKQGLLITNGEFVGRWSSEDSVCLEIEEENLGSVVLTNCSFWGPVKTCVWSKAKNSRVTLNACEFVNWDEVHSSRIKEGAPAIKIDAGRASLIGNSFEQNGVHLFVGEDALQVIATGNQAEGGFKVVGNKNPAKLQLVANEQDPLESVPEGKNNYLVQLGSPGDSRFITGWFGPEDGDSHTFRWSGGVSFFTLPVSNETKSVTVELDFDAPDTAVPDDDPENVGVFSGEKKLADIQKGGNHIVLNVSPDELELSDERELCLSIRCKAWRPKDHMEDSNDERALGVSCYRVRVFSNDVKTKDVFDANMGEWIK